MSKYLLWCYKLIVTSIFLLSYCITLSSLSFASPSTEGIQEYHKNLPLSPERKQKLADDISRYRNADNLWEVFRQEFSLPHYEDNPYVQTQIEWLLNNQEFLVRSATRAAPYLYYILQQVRKRHLPAEVALLPIIESGYNPFAYSTAGATGIWQMMPSTASGFGIKQDWWYDGRRDVIASTRAALNYLAYLQNFFDGNWLLAFAGYNAGEGRVLSSIRKNVGLGDATDFWSLPLPQETRDYVPRLLALAIIISNPDRYPIAFPSVQNAPYLAQIDVGGQINLKHAASLAGLSFKYLMELNPGFNHASTSPNMAYKLVVPIENIEQLTENLAYTPDHHAIDWIRYKVKSSDSLTAIAKRFNTSASTLRNLNRLEDNHVIPGKIILIPGESNGDNPLLANAESQASVVKQARLNKHPQGKRLQEEIISITNKTLLQNSMMASNELDMPRTSYNLQAGDTIYMVRNNDTLNSIATRFHISPSTLLRVNQLAANQIKVGKQLVIPTHTEIKAQPNDSKIKTGDTIYLVKSGDTMELIAEKFHTTAAAIRVANVLASNKIQEGEELLIPTHFS